MTRDVMAGQQFLDLFMGCIKRYNPEKVLVVTYGLGRNLGPGGIVFDILKNMNTCEDARVVIGYGEMMPKASIRDYKAYFPKVKFTFRYNEHSKIYMFYHNTWSGWLGSQNFAETFTCNTMVCFPAREAQRLWNFYTQPFKLNI